MSNKKNAQDGPNKKARRLFQNRRAQLHPQEERGVFNERIIHERHDVPKAYVCFFEQDRVFFGQYDAY
jgi:hypothetical protein